MEDEATQLARHYGLASISMREALYELVRANATTGLRLYDFMYDRIHPNDKGQRQSHAQCTAPSALRAQCTDPSALSADTRTALTLLRLRVRQAASVLVSARACAAEPDRTLKVKRIRTLSGSISLCLGLAVTLPGGLATWRIAVKGSPQFVA